MKLARVAQKIFGSGAGVDQIGVFGSLFAGSAATTTSAATAQSLSNWLTGWFGAAIGGNAPAIEDMNAVCFVMAYQLAYIFQAGVPEWNTDTTYYIGSFCSSGGVIYKSTIDDNSANDPTADSVSWTLQSSDQTGVGKDFWGTTLPAGYVWASGKTIGNSSSNATERANADTLNLYTLLWNAYPNSILQLYDSSGSPVSRGGSAATDFAANKALAVIDKRGRVSVGLDNIGGTTAGRITSTTVSPDGITPGASGGEQTHQLTNSELSSHTHAQNAHNHIPQATTQAAGSGNPVSSTLANSGSTYTVGGSPALAPMASPTTMTTATNQNTGGDLAHNNVQPSILCNYIIKL